MSIDLSENGAGFEQLRAHIGHKVVVVGYVPTNDGYVPTNEESVNVSLECETCGEVLLDYDAPEDEDESEQQLSAEMKRTDSALRKLI